MMGKEPIRRSDLQNKDERGLVCRGCGCRHFLVVYTRKMVGGGVERRRECRNCGRRITTREEEL